MKKFIKTVALAVSSVLLCSVLAFAADANIGFEEYEKVKSFKKKAITITKRTGKITINGKATEAAWKKAKNYASQINHYKETKSGKYVAKNTDPYGTKVKTWKMLWDETYLYIFVTVNDKYPSEPIGSSSDSDNVEYHIDAKNCDKTSVQVKCDCQYRLGRAKDTRQRFSGWGRLAKKESPGSNKFSDANWKKTAKSVSTSTSYSQELKINLKKHGVKKLTKGSKVGFDIQVNDAKTGLREYQLTWNSQDLAWANPKSMGTLILK